jgi:hypothetical protein
MKYVQLVTFEGNEYDAATATTLEEDKQLIASGFQYVTERNGIKLYRKPKRFIGLCKKQHLNTNTELQKV